MRIRILLAWGLSILLIVAIFLFAQSATSYAQVPGPQQSFPETGFTVGGEFLTYYRTIAQPMVTLGYPISNEEEDPLTGKLVQYFLFGRLELDPTAPQGQRVSISNLGELLYTSGAPLADIPTNGPTCRLFKKTGKSVCHNFLLFYDGNEGARNFGNPISQVEIHDGRMVQYFEKVRLEWRPEAPAGMRMAVSPLGKYYYDRVLNGKAQKDLANIKVEDITVRAFPAHALATSNSHESLYVIVQDQALKPVPQAMVGVIVTLPSGHQEYYRSNVTNQDGISTIDIPVGDVPVKEIVKIEVVASYSGMEKRTNTWFRVWW